MDAWLNVDFTHHVGGRPDFVNGLVNETSAVVDGVMPVRVREVSSSYGSCEGVIIAIGRLGDYRVEIPDWDLQLRHTSLGSFVHRMPTTGDGPALLRRFCNTYLRISLAGRASVL